MCIIVVKELHSLEIRTLKIFGELPQGLVVLLLLLHNTLVV